MVQYHKECYLFNSSVRATYTGSLTTLGFPCLWVVLSPAFISGWTLHAAQPWQLPDRGGLSDTSVRLMCRVSTPTEVSDRERPWSRLIPSWGQSSLTNKDYISPLAIKKACSRPAARHKGESCHKHTHTQGREVASNHMTSRHVHSI